MSVLDQHWTALVQVYHQKLDADELRENLILAWLSLWLQVMNSNKNAEKEVETIAEVEDGCVSYLDKHPDIMFEMLKYSRSRLICQKTVELLLHTVARDNQVKCCIPRHVIHFLREDAFHCLSNNLFKTVGFAGLTNTKQMEKDTCDCCPAEAWETANINNSIKRENCSRIVMKDRTGNTPLLRKFGLLAVKSIIIEMQRNTGAVHECL